MLEVITQQNKEPSISNRYRFSRILYSFNKHKSW